MRILAPRAVDASPLSSRLLICDMGGRDGKPSSSFPLFLPSLAHLGLSWGTVDIDMPESSQAVGDRRTLGQAGNLETDPHPLGPTASWVQPSQPFDGELRAQKEKDLE